MKTEPRAAGVPGGGLALLATAALLSLLAQEPAMAASAFAADGPPPLSQMFTLLFLTLGPFKLIQPFAIATRGAEPARDLRLALLSVVFASAGLALAGAIGEGVLANYEIPLPILAFAGGLILFLVALLSILRQFDVEPVPTEAAATAKPLAPLARTAISPLAFPGIVTPYGIAALVVFLALTPDAAGRLSLAGLVAAIMALNLATMLLTRRLLPILSIVLPILGAVLGVVQVALGLKIMNASARALLAM
jgi:multiple antibiotic resistance protein